jgi:adenosine/AMP kinase
MNMDLVLESKAGSQGQLMMSISKRLVTATGSDPDTRQAVQKNASDAFGAQVFVLFFSNNRRFPKAKTIPASF